MAEQIATLSTGDGFTLHAFEARPENPQGGLVILQEIFGVTEQLKHAAGFFAQHGYHAIVPALFDRVSPDTVIPYEESDRARATMQRLAVDEVMRDIAAAIAHVDSERGVSVLGYCWGGGMAIRAASIFPLAGAVAYYGTALDKHIVNGAKCPTLFHFGESDPLVPVANIERVKQQLTDAEVHIYAAGHAFANEARSNHVAEAAQLANQRTLDFLARVHGGVDSNR